MKSHFFYIVFALFLVSCSSATSSSDANQNGSINNMIEDSADIHSEILLDSINYDTTNVDGNIVRYKVASKRDTIEGHGQGIYCDLILPDYGPLSAKMVMTICKVLGAKLQVNFFYVFRNTDAHACYYNIKNCPPHVSAKMGQDYLGEFVVATGPKLKPVDMPQKHDHDHKEGDGHKH